MPFGMLEDRNCIWRLRTKRGSHSNIARAKQTKQIADRRCVRAAKDGYDMPKPKKEKEGRVVEKTLKPSMPRFVGFEDKKRRSSMKTAGHVKILSTVHLPVTLVGHLVQAVTDDLMTYSRLSRCVPRRPTL